MKWLSYFLLLLVSQFFGAAIGSYSSTKHSIGQELHFSEKFFGNYLDDSGIVDMISMFARLISSFYTLVITSKKINQIYFYSIVIQTGSMILLASSHFFQDISVILFVVGMFGFGLGRGVYSFPYLLLSQFFNQPEDICAVNVWFGLGNGGNLYAFLMYIWFTTSYGMHWTVIIIIVAIIYFCLTFLTYKFVPEVEIQNEQVSVCEGIWANWAILKEHYRRQVSNVLFCIDFSFQENLLLIFLFWAPYYFMKEGFGEKAALIGICYPAGSLIGSLVLIPAVSLC